MEWKSVDTMPVDTVCLCMFIYENKPWFDFGLKTKNNTLKYYDTSYADDERSFDKERFNGDWNTNLPIAWIELLEPDKATITRFMLEAEDRSNND